MTETLMQLRTYLKKVDIYYQGGDHPLSLEILISLEILTKKLPLQNDVNHLSGE